MRRPGVLEVGTDDAVSVTGDNSRTSLQALFFFIGDAYGVPLHEWTDDFLVPRPFRLDIVEDFVPVP